MVMEREKPINNWYTKDKKKKVVKKKSTSTKAPRGTYKPSVKKVKKKEKGIFDKMGNAISEWQTKKHNEFTKSLDKAYKNNPNIDRRTTVQKVKQAVSGLKPKPITKGSRHVSNFTSAKLAEKQLNKKKVVKKTKAQVNNPLGTIKTKTNTKTKLPAHVAVISTKVKTNKATEPTKKVKTKVSGVTKPTNKPTNKQSKGKSEWRKKNYSEELKARQLKMYNAGAFGNISKEKAVDGLPGKLTRAATAKYRSSNKGNVKKVTTKKATLKPTRTKVTVTKAKTTNTKSRKAIKTASTRKPKSISAQQAMSMYKKNRDKKGL